MSLKLSQAFMDASDAFMKRQLQDSLRRRDPSYKRYFRRLSSDEGQHYIQLGGKVDGEVEPRWESRIIPVDSFPTTTTLTRGIYVYELFEAKDSDRVL